jgi:hypothetical protein
VEPADLKAFARRNWDMVSEAKTAFWLEQKDGMAVADVLELADQLRLHASAVRPDWPTPEERSEDLAVHLRVSEALRAVSIEPR